MRPSLFFLAGLVALAVVCAAASLIGLARQSEVRTRTHAEQLTGGSVELGREALRRFGCGGCHQIDGVKGAAGQVGPSLNGIAVRAQIAGRLGNTPDNLVRWIRQPQEVDPGNGMPDTPMSEAEARHLAAYLYTLKSGS